MPLPTQTDANLLVDLAQLQCSMGISEATNWMHSDKFRRNFGEFIQLYPAGSREFELVIRVLNFGETVGTLYKHHLINEDLLFDWLAVSMHWRLVEDIVAGIRSKENNTSLYENFELAARAHEGWHPATQPQEPTGTHRGVAG